MNKRTHRMTQATEFIHQRYSYKRKSGLGKSRSWRWSCGTHVTASQAEQLQMRGMNSYRLIFNLFREMSRVANNGLFSKPKRIFASQTNFKNINAVLGLDNSLQFSSWISKKVPLVLKCLKSTGFVSSTLYIKKPFQKVENSFLQITNHSQLQSFEKCMRNKVSLIIQKFNFQSLQKLLKNEFNCSNIIMPSH